MVQPRAGQPKKKLIKKEGPSDRKLVGKKVEGKGRKWDRKRGKKPPLTKSTFIEAVSSD